MAKDAVGAVLAGLGRAALWTARESANGATRIGQYLSANRSSMYEGARTTTVAAEEAARSFGRALYDSASVKLFSSDEIAGLKTVIEGQSAEYRSLTRDHTGTNRVLDSLSVGGDILQDILKYGPSPDVKAAYAAAYPDLATDKTFEEAVSGYSDDQLLTFISGVKGKLFELEYAEYLNDGHLPDGYQAVLAHSANQPGWDIAIHGSDHHVASLLQLKATDSVQYVKHALERYPDIDVVTTDEVYSQLVMNGAADHVVDSGLSNADITQTVTDSVHGCEIQMHWDLPVISLALIAFTTYTLKDADIYSKALHAGERAGKSYFSYLIGGGVACMTQTWWLGLVAGVGTRLLAAKGKRQREVYNQLVEVVDMNNKVISDLRSKMQAISC